MEDTMDRDQILALEALWADNPRLHRWLDAQRDAFPAWARGTGQDWDFSPGSLDRLEAWIRTRFSGYDAVCATEHEPDVTVPAWYLGEVQHRLFGAVWQSNPVEPTHPDHARTPTVRMPITDEQIRRLEEWGDLYEPEDHRPGCHPVMELKALFVRQGFHLRDLLGQYTRG